MMNKKSIDALYKAIAETGGYFTICDTLGLSLKDVREHIKENPDRYELALGVYREKIQAATLDKAVNGWVEPVFYQGEQVGEKPCFSPGLLGLLYKDTKPEGATQEEGGVLVAPAESTWSDNVIKLRGDE